MPCYTKRVFNVDLTFAWRHPWLLKRAVEALGGTFTELASERFLAQVDGVRLTISGSRATVEKGEEAMVQRLQQEYGMQAAQANAEERGWTFERTSATTFTCEQQSLFS